MVLFFLETYNFEILLFTIGTSVTYCTGNDVLPEMKFEWNKYLNLIFPKTKPQIKNF